MCVALLKIPHLVTYIIITLLEARNALLFNKLIGFSCLKQHPKEMKPKKEKKNMMQLI